jgi:uncharacterized damage-inducible protein DinB
MSHEILLEGLRLGPGLLRELVQAIPPEALERRRGEGFWTLREHLEHLVAVQPMLYGRLESFLREERPEITPYVPGRDEEPVSRRQKSPEELLELFERWRLRQIDLIQSASPEIWQRRALHPEYESYSFEILVRHILLHDGSHLYRMEELWLMTDKALAEA